MGAWWAGVYGVAQSRAQLNWLSSSSRSSLLLKTSLFAGSRGYSVIAVYWLFNPVLLLMYITGTRALRLSCSPPAYLPGAFAIFPNQVLSTGSKGKTLWKEFEINHFYMTLGTMAYLWGDWKRIVPASNNLLRSRMIEVPLPSVPRESWSYPAMWLCSYLSFWIPH